MVNKYDRVGARAIRRWHVAARAPTSTESISETSFKAAASAPATLR